MNRIPDSKSKKFIYCLLFGVTSWAAWPAGGFAPLLFVTLLPLLAIEESVLRKQRAGEKARLYGWSYLSFFLFNILTTWWIWFASPFGMFGAVLANTAIMAGVFQLFHIVRRKLGDFFGYASLLAFWLSFEYLHLDWDLTWPWLNLGNGFAAYADMVQWYEYTGTQGGTLWILLSNLLLFSLLKEDNDLLKKKWWQPAFLIALPVLLSFVIKLNVKETNDPVEVVAVQPNIDPYNEKFSGMSSTEQLAKILRLANSKITPKTRLVVCPETALSEGIWLNDLYVHPQIETIKEFIKPYPKLHFFTGLNAFELYENPSLKSATARKFKDANAYYDVYNAAVNISNEPVYNLHYKSKLVPGVEKMPFPAFFGHLDAFAIDLGGTSGSLGCKDRPTVFKCGNIIAAPVICYESIYGEYVGDYVRQGANLICIMTNDGWWSDTPGYRQHCQYARLRAIEMRRDIARSANTGISCFVNQKGEITDKTKWWTDDCIRKDLNLNNELTFYAKYGDYSGRIAIVISILFLTASLIRTFLRKK